MGKNGTNKRPKRKRRIFRKIILTLLLLLILAAVAVGGYFRLKQQYTVTYTDYTATIGTISNSLSFSGTLQVIDSAAYTAPSSTTVRTVYVEKGQDVKEGDALIRLANGHTIEAGFDGRVNQLPVKGQNGLRHVGARGVHAHADIHRSNVRVVVR